MLSARPPPRRHRGHEPCAAHQACQGHQGVGQDQFAETVHAGERRIHGRHEPLHHPKRERPRARGRRAHPVGVRARGSEAAVNLWLGAGCLGWRGGPPGWSAVNKAFISYVKKKKVGVFYLGYSQSMPSSFCKYGKGFGGVDDIVLLSGYCKERESEKLKNYMW